MIEKTVNVLDFRSKIYFIDKKETDELFGSSDEQAPNVKLLIYFKDDSFPYHTHFYKAITGEYGNRLKMKSAILPLEYDEVYVAVNDYHEDRVVIDMILNTVDTIKVVRKMKKEELKLLSTIENADETGKTFIRLLRNETRSGIRKYYIYDFFFDNTGFICVAKSTGFFSPDRPYFRGWIINEERWKTFLVKTLTATLKGDDLWK